MRGSAKKAFFSLEGEQRFSMQTNLLGNYIVYWDLVEFQNCAVASGDEFAEFVRTFADLADPSEVAFLKQGNLILRSRYHATLKNASEKKATHTPIHPATPVFPSSDSGASPPSLLGCAFPEEVLGVKIIRISVIKTIRVMRRVRHHRYSVYKIYTGHHKH